MTELVSYKNHRIYTMSQTAPEADAMFLVVAVIRGPRLPTIQIRDYFYIL